MTIQVLEEAVASQIAAGEVIERPASVVKELIENAIDAGASRITVRIEDAGRKLIEITDDGCGIQADELAIAVRRHATSKLRNAEDLFHIHTLGFRGEALAAAGSVSRLTITTRAAEAAEGHRIEVESGEIISNKPVSANVGTIVLVEDLFYNVPARLKFLKSDTTERNQIETLISRYALAYPGIRWQLINNNKTSIQTSGNGNYREILASIYDLETARAFIEIDFTEDDLHIFGFISPVAKTRANRREMNYFVNGRWVQDVSLNASIARAYQTLIMVGRFPLVALFIEMDPEFVDVNVHPAKAEVRFRNPERVISAVHRAVRRGLVAQSPVPELNTPMVWPSFSAQNVPAYNPQQTTQPGNVPLWRSALEGTQDSPLDSSADEAEQFRDAAASANPQNPAETIPDANITAGYSALPMQNQANAPFFPILRWVGQIGATYIIAEGPDGLYLIDQHAAHERVLFEKLLSQEDREASQMLLEPELVQLPPWQASLLEDNMDIMKKLGFGIEEFGPSTFRVISMPHIFGNGNPRAAIGAVVDDFEEDETPLQGLKEARIAARVCKRMAVKAGQTLNETEQRTLLRDLEQCQSPRTCPHGRPTMIHLSISLLEKQFGRKGPM